VPQPAKQRPRDPFFCRSLPHPRVAPPPTRSAGRSLSAIEGPAVHPGHYGEFLPQSRKSATTPASCARALLERLEVREESLLQSQRSLRSPGRVPLKPQRL
jgi:hypothetical protein